MRPKGGPVVWEGEGEIEPAGISPGCWGRAFGLDFDIDWVDARFETPRSLGTGGNGHVGGENVGGSEEHLDTGRGGRGPSGGVVAAGMNEVRFDEPVLSGSGGNGMFGGGCGDGEY